MCNFWCKGVGKRVRGEGAIGKTNSLCAAHCTLTEDGTLWTNSAGLRTSAPLTARATAKDCMGKYAAERTLIKVMVRGCLALGYQNSLRCGIPPIDYRCEGWHSIWCALTQQKVLCVWPCCLLLIKVCKLSTGMCVQWVRWAVGKTVYHVALGKAFVWITRLIGTGCSEWEWQTAAFLMWPPLSICLFVWKWNKPVDGSEVQESLHHTYMCEHGRVVTICWSLMDKTRVGLSL